MGGVKYPVYSGGAKITCYSPKFNCEGNTIIVVNQGSVGTVSFIKERSFIGEKAYKIVPKQEVVATYGYSYHSFNRYLYHLLAKNSQYFKDESRGPIPRLHIDVLRKLKVHLPPAFVLETVVVILDLMESLVISLDEHLTTDQGIAKVKNNYYMNSLFAALGSSVDQDDPVQE